MCLAGSLFPVMNGLAKLLAETYSFEQVVWARTLSHLILVLIVLVPKYGISIVLTNRPSLQLLMSFMLLASTFVFFAGIQYISVVKAASITFTAPLIVVLLSSRLLGEKVTRERIAGVVVGFIGVLVVIRPGTELFQWASLLIVASATFYALYQILLRRVATIDRPETSVVYSALVGSVLMSLLVPFYWKTPDSLQDVLLLCSLGALGALGHYCVAKAMTYAPANFVSPFNYWQMVGSVFVGYWLFSDIPDTFMWLGSFLIIAAGFYVSLKAEK
jgi:drug/metabolite transporter (DMT)-like permease